MRACAVLTLVAALLQGACAGADPAARDLTELIVRDSTYYEPVTMEPFTGRVWRAFPDDSSRVELEGALLDGTWHGELVVYHPSGRIRYLGSFANGRRCGPWTENSSDVDPGNVLQQLRSEIESLGMYPPCPPDVER